MLLHQRVRASDTDTRSGDDITWMLMAVDVGNGLVLRRSITIDRQIHSQSIARRPSESHALTLDVRIGVVGAIDRQHERVRKVTGVHRVLVAARSCC